MSRNHILFLCTGNYYRSRYAEELFNHRAKIDGLAWRAFSRGVAETSSPENVGPMSQFALEALQAKAIVPEGLARYPQPCSLADFHLAELVIALKEAEHRPYGPYSGGRNPGDLRHLFMWEAFSGWLIFSSSLLFCEPGEKLCDFRFSRAFSAAIRTSNVWGMDRRRLCMT